MVSFGDCLDENKFMMSDELVLYQNEIVKSPRIGANSDTGMANESVMPSSRNALLAKPKRSIVYVPLAAVILFEFPEAVSYTHLRAHETVLDLVCRLLLEKKKKKRHNIVTNS